MVSFGSLSDGLDFRASAPSLLWPPGGGGVPGLSVGKGGD